MRGIATTSPENPDFARVIAVADLRPHREFAFDVAPDEAETARLERLLDARSIRKMRFEGTIRTDGSGWRLDGGLGASVVQTCVVTLEPVTTQVDVPVCRRFLPMEVFGSAVEVSPEEDDEVEPLEERIDLGLVAIEALALALPAYPRKKDAPEGPRSASPPGVKPAGDGDEEKPFASLAAFRAKMDKEN